VILSICPPHAALDVARAVEGFDGVYVDANAISPMRAQEVAAIQPFQRNRREQLFGRLLGARAAGQAVPRYRGFDLLRLSMQRPRTTIRTLRGSFRRVRANRRGVAR
jgi:coenzyme F420 hydrogenase subunit beta